MATIEHAKQVQVAIDYSFRSEDLLLEALTAAGAVEDKYDGNRRLAQLGSALVEFLLVLIGYETRFTRDGTSNLKTHFGSIKHRAMIARRVGIDNCIKYDTREGACSSSVVGKALNAILAAVFIESKDFNAVLGVMIHLGGFADEDVGVDPTMLSLDQTAAYQGLTSIIDAILRVMAIGNGLSSACESMPHMDHERGDTQGRELDHGNLELLGEQDNPLRIAAFTDGIEEDTDSQLVQDCNKNYSSVGCSQDHTASDSPLGDVTNESSSCDWGSVSHVNQRSIPTRKRVAASSATGQAKKRKSSPTRQSQLPNARLERYLSQEEEKCNIQGLPPPQETFFKTHIKERILNFGDGQLDTLGTILIWIAIPSSIAILQEVLRSSRTLVGSRSWHLNRGISNRKRFSIIEELDEQIAYLHLLRRYHILELFEECRGPQTRSCMRLVLATPGDFGQSKKKAGNPGNNAEAQVTETMMKEMFPDMQPDTERYKNKYKVVKRLRQLGRRLHIMVTHFGKGILGLMPDHSLTGPSHLGISDQMILKPSIGVFMEFIALLEKSQGDTLREFSAAVSRIVDPFLYGTLPQHEPFALEKVEPTEILEHSKGSQALLRLIG